MHFSSEEAAEKCDITYAGGLKMSPQELLFVAVRLHRDGRLDDAEKCYQVLLDLEPQNANAMHFMGMLLQQKGHLGKALELIEASISLEGTVAGWHNNLGNVLLASDRFEDAARSYARCVQLDPENMEVLNNLGMLHRYMGRPVQAEEMLLRALQRDPSFANAHYNLANLYCKLNRMPEAFSHYADALALQPSDLRSRSALTIALGKAGRLEEGRQACREWLNLEPDSAQAHHFYAAFGGTATPDRASDAYLVSEFDSFAETFDAKLAGLEYRAPQWIGESVRKILGEPVARERILDLGCGTGLCAPMLRPFAEHLAGVDLSQKMLERAQQRNLYDNLIQLELVAYLQECQRDWNILVSADTLIYFGRLESVFMVARQVLCAGGHMVFTLEAHDLPDDFILHTHGRYSHAHGYVTTALTHSGFTSIDIQKVELRFESGNPVTGWLVVAS